MKERRASLNLPFNSRTELIQIVPKLPKSDKNQVKLSTKDIKLSSFPDLVKYGAEKEVLEEEKEA